MKTQAPKRRSFSSLKTVFIEAALAVKTDYLRAFSVALFMFGGMQILLSPLLHILESNPKLENFSALLPHPGMAIALIFTLALFNLGSVLNLLILAGAHQKKRYPLFASLKLSFHLFPKTFLVNLLSSFCIAIGLVFFNFLGFLLAALLAISLPIAIFEQRSPWLSLKLSVQRTFKQFTLTILVAATLWLITFGGGNLFDFVLSAFPSLSFWLSFSLQTLFNSAVFPLSQALLVALFFELSYVQKAPKA